MKNGTPLPCNIGRKGEIIDIDGRRRPFVIEDEIKFRQSDNNGKLIYLQRLKFKSRNKPEYRFGYYMTGIKPRERGRWVWGQGCLVVPARDLRRLVIIAQGKGWFKEIPPNP